MSTKKEKILQAAHSMVVEYCLLNGDTFNNLINAITRDIYPTNNAQATSEFHLNIKKCINAIHDPHTARIHIVHFAQIKWISTLAKRPLSMLPTAHHLILFFKHINIDSIGIKFTQSILEEFIVQCLMSTNPQNTDKWQQYLSQYCITKEVCPNYKHLHQLCGKSKSSKEFREFLLKHSWKSFTDNLKQWCNFVLNALKLSPDDALLSQIVSAQNETQTIAEDDGIFNAEAADDNDCITINTNEANHKQNDSMIISTDEEEEEDIERYPSYADMPLLERGTQSQSIQLDHLDDAPIDIEMIEATIEDDYDESDEKTIELHTPKKPASNLPPKVQCHPQSTEPKEPQSPQTSSNGFSLGAFERNKALSPQSQIPETDCNPNINKEQKRGRKRSYNEIEKSVNEASITHNAKRARINSPKEEKENTSNTMNTKWPKWMKKGIELTVDLSDEPLFCIARKVSSTFVLIKITDDDAPDKYKNKQIKIYLKDKHKLDRVLDINMCDSTADDINICDTHSVSDDIKALAQNKDKEEANECNIAEEQNVNEAAELLTDRPLRAGGKHSVCNDLFDSVQAQSIQFKNGNNNCNNNANECVGGRFSAAFKDIVSNDDGVELEYDEDEWKDNKTIKTSIYDRFEPMKPSAHLMPEQLINPEFITNPELACGITGIIEKKKKKKRKTQWNDEEIDALIEGYEKYKKYVNVARGKQGIWSYINKDAKFGNILSENGRENANLCDKWRHLVKKKDARIQHLVDNETKSSKKKKQT